MAAPILQKSDPLSAVPDAALAQTAAPPVEPKADWSFLQDKPADPYAKYDPETQTQLKADDGLLGTLKHGGYHALNQLFFGAVDPVVDKFRTDKEKAYEKAYNETHIADDVGGAIGTVGNLAATGGVLGGVAKGARVALAGAELAEGANLATKAVKAGRVVGGLAAESAVVSAPQALADAALQDPKQAAENFALNVGFGAALGVAGKVLKPAAQAADNLLQKGVQRVQQYADENTSAIKQLLNGKQVTKETEGFIKQAGGDKALNIFLRDNPQILSAEDPIAAARQFAQEAAENAGRAQGTQAAPSGFGSLGNSSPQASAIMQAERTAKQAQTVADAFSHVEQLADSAGLSDQLKSTAFKAALVFGAYKIDPTLGAITAVAAGGNTGAQLSSLKQTALNGALQTQVGQRLLNGVATALKDKTGDLITTSLSALTAGARYATPAATKILSDLGHTDSDVAQSLIQNKLVKDPEAFIAATKASQALTPDAQDALRQQINTGISYLADSYPKRPSLPGPFDQDVPWKPSRVDMRSFQDKLEVVNDPLSVVQRLRDGTLNSDHIKALDKVWPSVKLQLQSSLLDYVSDPDNKQSRTFLKKRQRQYNLLMEDTTSPASSQLAPAVPSQSPSSFDPDSYYGKAGLSKSGLSGIEPQTTDDKIAGGV